MKAAGVRVSLFVDPEPAAIRWAKAMGADRVELYTEPFARAFERGPAAAAACYDQYVAAASLALDLGVGVNAGHDLDLRNLTVFRELPHLDEVSIGHALISRAIFVGLGRVGERVSGGARRTSKCLTRKHDTEHGRVAPCRPAQRLLLVVAALMVASAAEAGGRGVTLPSLDGTPLAGELYEASSRPAPGVVLVHMLTRNRRPIGTASPIASRTPASPRWRSICAATAARRGSPQDLPAMVQDVRAAVQWLSARPGVRPGAIGMVGASLGASLALLAAVDLPMVRAIGLVSPVLDYRGLRTDTGPDEEDRRAVDLAGRQHRRSAGAAHAARFCARAIRPARTNGARATPDTARRCSAPTRRSAGHWWTGCAARCYPEHSPCERTPSSSELPGRCLA